MDEQLEKLKQLVGAELGRALNADEEHFLKGLLYFGRACKLKTQLDSEPERIGPIAKRVLSDIKGRMERQRALRQREFTC